MAESRLWKATNFGACLDRWIEIDHPSPDLRLGVTMWTLTRLEDPYKGGRRAKGFDNLWYATVPESEHGNEVAILCGYWIYEQTREVRCDSIVSLGLPH